MSRTTPSISRQPAEFRRALLGWYRTHRRRLPWRETPSLYKTVVSEFMLQQTQIKTALPYFSRWMEAFPDFKSLANASPDRVLKQWEGLGYYSRARNLHRLAQMVNALPSPPQTPNGWLELPGVGPYTAAAISSIHFAEPVPCVDGNVVRILARLTADRTPFRDSSSAARAFSALAGIVMNPRHPGDHNQAMMELGATVCVRHNPRCPECPVSRFCAGRRSGEPESFPQLAAKTVERRAIARAWCEKKGRLLLHRAAAGARRLADLHELPSVDLLSLPPDMLTSAPVLARRKRGITRYAITETIHLLPSPSGRVAAGLVWVPLKSLDSLSLSGPHRRWVSEILAERAGGR